uniref:Lebercilin domain-containing protein n=1 Tax=Syphacia muris TaxID=451379 RepID=A0A0N5A968_9BILA
MHLSGQKKLEYENQLKNLERSLSAEKSRREQYCFFNKQLSAQIKKLQVENRSLQKELNAVQKCSSCECLDFRRRKSSSSELGPQPHTFRSRTESADGSISRSDGNENLRDNANLRYLRESNEDLKKCIESLNLSLQNMATTKELTETIEDREREIKKLNLELETLRQNNFPVNLQERQQFIDRIKKLEEQLQNSNKIKANVEAFNSDHERCFPKSGCNSCKKRYSSWENLYERF